MSLFNLWIYLLDFVDIVDSFINILSLLYIESGFFVDKLTFHKRFFQLETRT